MNVELKVKELAEYKYLAAKAGRENVSWLDFVSRSKLGLTDFNSGDLAEIVICWMLGSFQRIDGDLSVHSSVRADMQGADIVLNRFVEAKVQLKFNKKNERYYGRDIVVIEVGPSRKFTGTFYLDKESGNNVLMKVLMESGLYSEEELYDLFEVEEEFEEDMRRAWEWIVN